MAETTDSGDVVSAALMLSRDPGSQGFTVADLHALPDDGPRYELIDGSIIVSPSATIDHNTIARWIANIVDESNPGEDHVVGSDQSATVDDHNEPRPDVVAARAAAFRQSPFPIADVVLAVEVVSPHSVLRDTETKRALYARAGVPSYWIVVPEEPRPRSRSPSWFSMHRPARMSIARTTRPTCSSPTGRGRSRSTCPL